MKIDQFFEKGYYLNLDRRVDRREHFEKEVKRHGLENFFERIPGVDSKDEPNLLQRHCYCGLSIHNTLKKIKENNLDRSLFLEDDMYFYDGGLEPGLQIVEKALDQLQFFPDWEIIYFGGYVFDEEVEQVSENLLKVKTVLTTHAMGLNKPVIDKLLEYVPFVDSPIDGWIGERKHIVKYLVWPLAVPQLGDRSDLDAFNFSPGIQQWLDSYKRINIKKK